MRTTIQLQVIAGEEPLFSRSLGPNRPLRLGPSSSATVPTLSLEAEVRLLEPVRGGYRVHLPAGLDGMLSVGGRGLRVEHGLLRDPRPEPLLLADGDSGELDLDGSLCLRFSIHAQRRAFRALPRIDRGLALSLSGCALAGALLALSVAHDLGSSIRVHPPTVARELRLTRRPASLIALQRRAPARLQPGKQVARRIQPAAPSRPARASSPLARARAAAGRQERILRRLLPGAGRGGDPLAVLEGLLGEKRARSAPRGTGSGSDLLTGSAGASGFGPLGPSSSLPGALALPRLGRLRREQPIASSSRSSTGGPSREAIRRVVSRGGAGVRLCYERELLAARVAREGQIVLRWTIDSNGRVSELAVVRDTVGSPELQSCLRAQVGAWAFPACPDRCAVHYPFEFYARSLGGV